MSARNPIARVEYFHPADPAGWLKPDEPFIVGGLDWSWAFVVYRPIVDFPGYCVGSNGRVWTCLKIESKGYRYGIKWVPGREWKPKQSYLQRGRHLGVKLFKNHDSKSYNRFVHTLVLDAFLGPCPPGKQCCHWDDVGTNNRLDNLRWDTPVANIADAFRNGRRQIGESHVQAKLSDEQIREIREEFASDRFTQSQLAVRFNTNQAFISQVVIGRSRKSAGGPLTKRGKPEIKLDQVKADELRKLVAQGMKLREAAAIFGIGYPTAYDVVTYRTWIPRDTCHSDSRSRG